MLSSRFRFATQSTNIKSILDQILIIFQKLIIKFSLDFHHWLTRSFFLPSSFYCFIKASYVLPYTHILCCNSCPGFAFSGHCCSTHFLASKMLFFIVVIPSFYVSRFLKIYIFYMFIYLVYVWMFLVVWFLSKFIM